MQSIDRLHDILRQLAPRPFPDGQYRDQAGEVRLTVRVMTWEAYVHLAFDEIRMAGAGSPQVARRLNDVLADLKSIAPPERVETINHQIDLLVAAVEAAMDDKRDVKMALHQQYGAVAAR